MGFASVPIPSREKIIEMNIQLDNDKITIGVDGLNQNNELKRYLEKYENHIFQLQREGDSVAFVKIGNRETACNESINVLYSSDDEIVRKISNLSHSPFEMDGIVVDGDFFPVFAFVHDSSDDFVIISFADMVSVDST